MRLYLGSGRYSRDMTKIRIAENINEYKAAFNLASSIFAKTRHEELWKQLSWGRPEDASVSNLIIALRAREVVGVVRICPTDMYWRTNHYKAAALTSICVSPEYQGNGIGRMLMEEAAKHCDENEFDFSYLVARRAVDHFYPRFGFFGASSYQMLKVRGEPRSHRSKVELRSFQKENSRLYSEWYRECYYYSFGRTRRDKEYWLKLDNRLEFLELSFREIFVDSQLVGYIVLDEEKVIELCFDRNVCESVINNLVSFLLKARKHKLSLMLPHDHAIVDKLTDYDVIFQSRRCLYGGHMMRWSSKPSRGPLELSIGVSSSWSSRVRPFFSLSLLDEK